jgi:hypothetical protein
MSGIALLLFSGLLSAQASKPISVQELAATTARGRMLAEYDAASWHATDAVLALNPVKGSIGRYIAEKTDVGWVVLFGKFSDAKDAFLVAYEAVQGSSPDQFTVKTHDPPQPEHGFFYIAANAIEIALQNSNLEKRPYNNYVLPADAGQLYVYILPAQTVTDIYPLGGDTRFLVSADGYHIIETRPLHKTILEVNRSAQSGAKTTVAGFHTHILTDTPEDTDVFHVLRQTHARPEYVGTRNGTYVIETDGTIKLAK